MNRFSFILLILLLVSLSANYLQFTQNQNSMPSITASKVETLKNHASPSKALNHKSPKDAPQTNEQQPISSQHLADKALAMFNRHLFDDAIALYEELALTDEVHSQSVKQAWLTQLRLWLEQKEWLLLEQFMQSFINRFSYDAEILTIRADALDLQGKPTQAIEQYIELRTSAFDTVKEEFYTARIRHIANSHIEILQAQKAWQQLVDFSEQQLIHDSHFPPYLLAQAEGLIGLADIDYAQDILEPILDISFYRQQAQDLLSKIDKARLHQTAIALEPIGEHYLVNGRINRSNPIRLMIDTGASISVLTKTMFDNIEPWTNPDFIRDSLINTAGGTINAPIYRFEQFQINEFVVRNVEFVVIDLDNMSDYHGLLGMNFLKEFKFEIDQQENLLVLSPK